MGLAQSLRFLLVWLWAGHCLCVFKSKIEAIASNFPPKELSVEIVCVKFLSQSTDANKDYTVLAVSITNIIESKIFAKFWDAVFL